MVDDKNERRSVLGMAHLAKHTMQEIEFNEKLCEAFDASSLPLSVRMQNFSRSTRRQDISRFIVKYEMFKEILSVNGSVIECGVQSGGGFMAWYHFSTIFEPYNHTRKIIGFDTFEGFPHLDEKDVERGVSEHLKKGGLCTPSDMKEEIDNYISLHDLNRPLGHIPKAELIKGDACKTIPAYVEENPHLLISLLYLDFDLYKPTKVALEFLFKRVVKGGIVAFDELNCQEFPGETTALLESLSLENVELRRSPFDPYISFFVK